MDLLKVNSNNETLLDDFFYFMKNHKPHGHKDWPEIKEEFCGSLTNELFEKKSFLYLLKESKTILNYFYIKFEKSINRIIFQSYNPEDLIEYSKYLLELKMSAIRNLHELDIHSGIKSSKITSFIPFYGSTEHHDLHHSKNKGNYASTFTIWDKVFGTEID